LANWYLQPKHTSGYLTDNRCTKNRIGSVKWSVRYCGLFVYHFNNIKDGLVAASKS